MSEAAIRVENLGKKYRIGAPAAGDFRNAFGHFLKRINPFSDNQGTGSAGDFWALKEINFEVQKGEAVGIIGRNGAGKSTLLKILSRITEPTTGYFSLKGRVSSLLEVGTGFHMELTGRENIFLNGTILGMRRREIREKFDEIVEFSGVETFLDTPVKHYSSGMKVRLAFSVAAHLEPEILIIDEVLAVGDAEFQKKCLGKMEDVTGQGRTVLFVSHNMGAVKNLCGYGILLEDGNITGKGAIEDVTNYYQHNTLKNIESLSQKRYTGTGKINFLNLRFYSGGQPLPERFGFTIIKSGADLDINIAIKSEYNINQKVFFAISVNDISGIKLSTLDNFFRNEPIHMNGNELRVSCKLSTFNLTPGRYYIDLWSSDGYETFQKIEQAHFLEVIESENHASGKFPSIKQHGYFQMDQIWEKI